jgi:D-alanyl-D-alanine carboxypeptidase
MTPCVPYSFTVRLRLCFCLALLCALAACGSSHSTRHAAVPRSPSRYYPPPGPASDPWGPYIREASGRFGVPEQWIRGVMHQESGGQEDVISWAGAIGLMQVMPETYAGLRDRYGLGNDPFDPHNNILAGTAYLREMYDRFGSPGFLAAYNAGPNRVDKYLNNGTPLPTETVNYVASIAPRLGPGTPMTGPLAVYGGRGVELASTGSFRNAPHPAARKPTPAGCDPDAAYDPDEPCKPLPPAPTMLAGIEPAPQTQTALAPSVPSWATAPAPQTASNLYRPPSIPPAPPPQRYAYAAPAAPRYTAPAAPRYTYTPPPPVARAAPQPVAPCDPDAAFDPSRHCVYTSQPYAEVASRTPQHEFASPFHRPVQAAPLPPAREGGMTAASPAGRWAIQVGAYATLPGAQSAAERARATLPDLLRMANVELPPTAPLGSKVAFRAQLTGLPAHVAKDACAKLSGHGMPCMTLPPDRA